MVTVWGQEVGVSPFLQLLLRPREDWMVVPSCIQGAPRGWGAGCGGCTPQMGVCRIPTVQLLRTDCAGLLTWVWAPRSSYSPGPGGP